MDITGIQTLEEATRQFERQGMRLLLCEARTNVLRKLVRAGFVGKHIPPYRYFRDLSAALLACQEEPASASPRTDGAEATEETR